MKNLNEAMLGMKAKRTEKSKALKESKAKLLKEGKLIWTSEPSGDEDGYYDEQDYEIIKEDFEESVLPNIKNQCRNDILIMAGTVGRWNGTSDGGTVIDVDDLYGFGDVDEVEIVEENNQLIWRGHHHDGTHEMALYTIPDDEISRKKIIKDMGILDWLKDMYQWADEEDAVEDALARLDSVSDLSDALAPEDYAKAKDYFKPILADQTPTTEKKELKEDNNDEIVWEDFDKYSEESIGKIRNILENLDLEVVDYKEDKDFYSVCIKDKNSGLSFWMDYHYEGKDPETPIDTDEDDLVGEWNQYIFSTTDDNDMIRKAIQTSYMKNTGDMVAFEEFDGVGYDYLQTKFRDGNKTENLNEEAEENKVYVITNQSGTKKMEVNQKDISDWSGDLALWGNENGRIMMYWNEEKGYDYIDHIYMEYDTEISPLLKNLTKDTPLLVTLSDKDYDTFEGWKEGKTLDNESKEIKTEAAKPTIPGLEDYENIADKFHSYPAFKANFGELVVIKDKYDSQYKVYKPNAVDSNSYIYYSYSDDMIDGWMYGAVMAKNGIFKDMKGESLQESRVNRVLHAGDRFVNPNGVECIITSVDTEHLLDGEPQVTYKIGKDYKCYKQSSVNGMLDQNQYKEEDNTIRKAEAMEQDVIDTLDQVYSESLNEEVTVKGMKDIIDNAKNDFQINGAIHTLGFKDANLSNKLRTQFKDMQSNGSSFEDIKSALSAELVPAMESKESEENSLYDLDFVIKMAKKAAQTQGYTQYIYQELDGEYGITRIEDKSRKLAATVVWEPLGGGKGKTKVIKESKELNEAKLTCPLQLTNEQGDDWDKKEIKEYIEDMKNKYNVKITVTNKEAFGWPVCNIRGSREDLEKYIEDELDPDIYLDQIEESKELNEDQYDNERRKSTPSTKKIAKEEYEDNIEWYKEHIKDYANVADFISQNRAEIASEYNLKADKAQVVCSEIYKLATSKSESINIGDKVKITNSNDLHNGKEGEVTYIDDEITTVKLSNGRSFNYDKNQVQKIEEDIKSGLGIEPGSDEEAKLDELQGRNFKDEFNALSKEEQNKYKELIPVNHAFLSPEKVKALAKQYGVDEGILYWVANIGKFDLTEKKFNLDKADDISYMKSTNQYNYDKRQLRIDKKNKTYELGQFKILGKSDKYTDKEIDNTIAKLKELGYKEVKKDR